MTAKRIIVIVLCSLLLAGSVFCLVWGIINWNKVKEGMSGAGIYTKDDIQASYEDGYGAALENKQQYEKLIAEYRDKLTDYEIIKKELTVSKDNINELNEKVYRLQTYVKECEDLIDKMKAENYRLQSQIDNLETINSNLMQSVNAYIQLIGSISIIEERFVVTFMFDDAVYSIVLVPDGEKVQIDNPESTDYTIFLGWSLSRDGDLIDLNEIEIAEDTVIYAKIIRKYDVNFILDYAVYDHQIIEKGQTVTAKTPTSTNRRVFKGWALDGVNVIDVTDYPVTEHRTFFAVVEERNEVKFIYTRHTPSQQTITLSAQYIGKSDSVKVPEPPTFSGYTFNGWLLNGVTKVGDPANYNFTGDTVFAAEYTANHSGVSGSYRFSTNSLTAQYNVLNYLKDHGHGYITNLQMLKSFSLTVRVYAGHVNGQAYTLTSNNNYVNRQSCNSFNETLTKGTLFFSIGLMANGYLQLQLTFEGASLANNSIFSGSLEIVSMTFTLNDF